jgi:uncharacterized membrane-anchored protein
MTAAHRRIWLLAGIVALVQSAILGSMVWDRIGLLRSGREVVLSIVPVDPRSLFRGDYVDLQYAEVSRVPLAGAPPPADGTRRVPRQPVYVTLEQGPDGTWKRTAAATEKPSRVAPHQVILQGLTRSERWQWRQGEAAVRYGIESYFVPEGKGLELEKLVREKKMAAVIAIDRHGRAAIKALVIDGKRVYEEPLL